MGQTTSQPDSRDVPHHVTAAVETPGSNAHRTTGTTHGNRQDTHSTYNTSTWRGSNLRPVATLSRQISSTSFTAIETSSTPFLAEHASRETPIFEPHITNISASPLPQRSRRLRLNLALTSWPTRFSRTDRQRDRVSRRASIFGSLLPSGSAARQSERRGQATSDSIYISASARESSLGTRRSSAYHLRENAARPTGPSIRSTHHSPHSLAVSLSQQSGSGQVDHQNQQEHQEEHMREAPVREPTSEADQNERSSSSLSLQPRANVNTGIDASELDRNNSDFDLTAGHAASTSSVQHIHDADAHRRSHRSSAFMHQLDMHDALRASSVGSRDPSRATSLDENTSLSQLMNATALAIATQISQNSDDLSNNRTAVTPETFDGLFQPIHQALQTLVRNRREQAGGGQVRTSTNPLRVFRLGSRTSSPRRRISPSRGRAEGEDGFVPINHSPDSPINDPLPNITVVVVAFRSAVTEGTALPPSRRGSINSRTPLLALPPLNESGGIGSGSRSESPFPQSSSRSRFSQLRRATHRVTPGNLEWLQNRSHAQGRTSQSSAYDVSDEDFRISSRHSQLGLEDSPPGPVPPPSTPAEHTTSVTPSESASPSRRQSILSSFQSLHVNGSVVHSDSPLQEAHSSHSERTMRSSRQRRRSESDAARHRFLGSGSARRNGVVEPDNLDEGDERASRNWLIYVIGTNASGNQRAWTAPGIFSDNPSYEELLILSSLLGPVKPPVASAADLASAGGLFRVSRVEDAIIVGHGAKDDSELQVPRAERCWICLENYQLDEDVRQLKMCAHVFHQRCIDEWLTTGRNSCPLCREEGVTESETNDNEQATNDSARDIMN